MVDEATRFSANLGFLWRDRSLPEAIRAAPAQGFDAVECHWPYDEPVNAVRQALADTGLTMLGLNTRPGDTNGLCALPDREEEAKASVDEAVRYAEEIGCPAIHVMAGRAEGPASREAFLRNLDYACRAYPEGTILIEPLNAHDAPGYFLRNTKQACAIVEEVGRPNLEIMFDCYHVARTEGAVLERLRALRPLIGHVQFAGVPDRGPPDRGSLDYGEVFALLRELNWERPLGAEYRPNGPTEASLGWLRTIRRGTD